MKFSDCGYASGLTRRSTAKRWLTRSPWRVSKWTALSRLPVAFNGVVVGEVVECGQHPNADKLRVTKVNVGGERLLDIVCGAPNCRQGLKVAVATIGAVLPGDFKIKAAKLRGEPSEGMLCSFS